MEEIKLELEKLLPSAQIEVQEKDSGYRIIIDEDKMEVYCYKNQPVNIPAIAEIYKIDLTGISLIDL